jgi:hypothetical protein
LADIIKEGIEEIDQGSDPALARRRAEEHARQKAEVERQEKAEASKTAEMPGPSG